MTDVRLMCYANAQQCDAEAINGSEAQLMLGGIPQYSDCTTSIDLTTVIVRLAQRSIDVSSESTSDGL